MPKTRPGITIDAYIWEQFQAEVDNASEELETFMENYIQSEVPEEKEKLKDKLERLKEKEEELQEQREQLQEQYQEVEEEKTKIRAKVRQMKQQKLPADESDAGELYG